MTTVSHLLHKVPCLETYKFLHHTLASHLIWNNFTNNFTAVAQ